MCAIREVRSLERRVPCGFTRNPRRLAYDVMLASYILYHVGRAVLLSPCVQLIRSYLFQLYNKDKSEEEERAKVLSCKSTCVAT